EAHHARSDLAPQAPHPRVVAVENRPISAILVAEQLRFGASVFVEVAIAIEMVLGKVEVDANVRFELLDTFELKTGHFDDRRVESASGRLAQRRPQVAADEDAPMRGLEDFADESRDRALAVCAGHRDYWRVDKAAGKFQLADHRDALEVRLDDQPR